MAPDEAQNARMVFCALASSLRGAGAAWSMKNTQVGALTRAGAKLLDLLDRQRAGAVLGDGDVHIGDDDLAGHHGVQPGVRGEDLLGESERRHEGFPALPAAPLSPIGTASPSRPR